MEYKKWVAIVSICIFSFAGFAQTKKIDEKKFFLDERPIEMKLSTDIKSLLLEKNTLNYVKANIHCVFPDSTVADADVQIKPRGHFRKENCRLTPLAVNFKNEASQFSKLGSLKLVVGCGNRSMDDEALIKEYLTYKIYNIITDMSFRVRLLNVTYNDTRGKVKSYTQYAYLVEDMDEVAKRNKCKKKENFTYSHDLLQRDHATLVYIFEYMIGNTDWSMPYYHNIKLMVSKEDSLSKPYPVAYDFDMTGLVNPRYGEPHPDLGLKNLQERLYRGYPRTVQEIEDCVNIFLEKKDAINAVITECPYLNNESKKEMINFLSIFFKEISNKKNLKRLFVDTALGQGQ